MSVSPMTISLMIGCCCTANPEEYLGKDCWNSSAGKSIREQLLAAGLIDNHSRSTAKGAAWVQLICETPLPVQAWVKP